MSDPTEPERVRRASQGDRDAFGELVEAHLARAYRVALALTGSADVALDATQDAIARVFEARARLDPARPFFPFLYQALRRRCFTLHRDEALRAGRLGQAFAARPAPATLEGDPARAASLREEHARCVAAIEALSPREREVLVLKDVEGLRYRDIADLVGIPLGTVMSRLYSARRRVALALEEAP